MTQRRNVMSRLWVVAVALGLAACGQDSGPLAPTGHGTTPNPATVTINGVQLLKAPVGLRLARSTTVQMDKSGGSIKVDGARLIVPSGALNGSTTITMANASDVWAYDFGPDGLQFNTSTKLMIRITQAELQQLGIDTDTLAIAYASGSSDNWQILGGTYDPVREVITLSIDHFSRYALCVE